MVYFEVRSWCISQANQVGNDSGGGTINYISFSHKVLPKQFSLFGESFSHSRNIFHSEVCFLVVLTRYLNLR